MFGNLVVRLFLWNGGACLAEKKAPAASDLYFVDAHSQIPHFVELETVLVRMKKNGVHRTILSANAGRDTASVAAFARRHPGRIIAAVRTKGREYRKDETGFYYLLDEQAESRDYGAMAEVMIYHTPKHNIGGNLSAQSKNYVSVLPGDERVRRSVRHAIRRGWPVVLHIESEAIRKHEGEKTREFFLKELDALLREYPRHPFVLNKLGQFSSEKVRRMIGKHPNIYFFTDHSTNPEKRRAPDDRWAQPWVNIFRNDSEFAPEWAALLVRHSGRFIFALDRVREKHWRAAKYKRSVRYFKRALSRLPAAAARAIAHGNAERLWKLPPRGR
ncbi:MAG: amidohydrolase family protein [bacterium]